MVAGSGVKEVGQSLWILCCFLPFLREMMSSDCFSAEEAHTWMLHHGYVVSVFPAKLLLQPW